MEEGNCCIGTRKAQAGSSGGWNEDKALVIIEEDFGALGVRKSWCWKLFEIVPLNRMNDFIRKDGCVRSGTLDKL